MDDRTAVCPLPVLPSVIAVLMLTAVTVLTPENHQRQLSSMFDNNWDVPLEVRSIGGQLNGGMLTLSQQECDEAP